MCKRSIQLLAARSRASNGHAQGWRHAQECAAAAPVLSQVPEARSRTPPARCCQRLGTASQLRPAALRSGQCCPTAEHLERPLLPQRMAVPRCAERCCRQRHAQQTLHAVCTYMFSQDEHEAARVHTCSAAKRACRGHVAQLLITAPASSIASRSLTLRCVTAAIFASLSSDIS